MQCAIQNVVAWAEKWQLGIANQKCSVVHLGNKNEGCNYVMGSLGSSPLAAEENIRDLGVIVSSNLKTSEQCRIVALKANCVTNMIFRMFQTSSKDVLLKAYKTYVRPLVEYCTPVWSPQLKKDIDLLEKVQRYFTRRLFARCNFATDDYVHRIAFLNLQPLEERRVQYDLQMCYDIIHNVNDLNMETFFTRAVCGRTKSNHSLKLFVRRTSKKGLATFFSNRVVPIWNSLPSHVQNCPLVTAQTNKLFKKRLKYVDLSTWLSFDRRM
jgi:ribonuclease P/MRP protein subunit RPP40